MSLPLLPSGPTKMEDSGELGYLSASASTLSQCPSPHEQGLGLFTLLSAWRHPCRSDMAFHPCSEWRNACMCLITAPSLGLPLRHRKQTFRVSSYLKSFNLLISCNSVTAYSLVRGQQTFSLKGRTGSILGSTGPNGLNLNYSAVAVCAPRKIHLQNRGQVGFGL